MGTYKDPEYKKNWYKNNKNDPEFQRKRKEYRESHKEEKSKQDKEYREKNKDRLQKQSKIYTKKNAEKNRKRVKEWRQNNKEKVRQYKKQRRLKDPAYKLMNNVSTSVRSAIKRNGGIKNTSTWKKLPYTGQQLREHLEKLWEPWMNWENYRFT